MLYMTEITVRTMSRRGARSPPSGTRSGIPAAPILRLARTMRCPTAVGVLIVALAICSVVRPHTARRVSASCAGSDSAGWQHPNSRGSRSSISVSTSGARSERIASFWR